MPDDIAAEDDFVIVIVYNHDRIGAGMSNVRLQFDRAVTETELKAVGGIFDVGYDQGLDLCPALRLGVRPEELEVFGANS